MYAVYVQLQYIIQQELKGFYPRGRDKKRIWVNLLCWLTEELFDVTALEEETLQIDYQCAEKLAGEQFLPFYISL